MQRLKQEVRRLAQSRLVRGVAKISGGTLLGQAIVLAASPVLTRLYTPEEFGVLGIYTAIVSVVAIMASLKYEQAIPVTARGDQHQLFALSLMLVFAVSISAFAVCLLFRPLLESYVTNAATRFVYLLPVGVFVAGLYQLLSAWAIRERAYGVLGETKVTQSLGMVLIQGVGGWLGGGSTGLILGDIVGRGGGVGRLGKLMKSDWSKVRRFRFSELSDLAMRYLDYPRYIGSATILNSASLYVPYFALQHIYGSRSVGLFLMVQRFVTAPSSILGKSIASVFYGDASEIYRTGGNISFVITKGCRYLLMISVPVFGILALISPWLFSSLLGREWIDAGYMARILVPAYTINLVATPFFQTFNIVGKQHIALWSDGIRIIIVLSTFFICERFELDLYICIAVYSACMTISYMITLGIAIKVARNGKI